MPTASGDVELTTDAPNRRPPHCSGLPASKRTELPSTPDRTCATSLNAASVRPTRTPTRSDTSYTAAQQYESRNRAYTGDTEVGDLVVESGAYP